eukprot:scaffold271_cov112-Isochrysis_galbana.AAC.5
MLAAPPPSDPSAPPPPPPLGLLRPPNGAPLRLRLRPCLAGPALAEWSAGNPTDTSAVEVTWPAGPPTGMTALLSQSAGVGCASHGEAVLPPGATSPATELDDDDEALANTAGGTGAIFPPPAALAAGRLPARAQECLRA